MKFKRVTLFAGHYGSGKTNLAVNYALMLRKSKENVFIADLDIVNPYFRTKDSQAVISAADIRVISSEYASSNVDLPALPAEAYRIVHDKSMYAVIDVGGDDRGALALGRYAPDLIEENNFDMFFVINKFRPLTRDTKSTIQVLNEIESASGMRFTSIINNSNLGPETSMEDIVGSIGYADDVALASHLPISYTSVHENLFGEASKIIENVIPISIHFMPGWSL